MAIASSFILRGGRIFTLTRVQRWSRDVNKVLTRQISTKPGTKVLENLKSRSLIKVAGNDSIDFLQGLITNDMKHFDEGAASIYSLFLNLKGRVLYESIIYRALEESAFYIECDSRVVHDLEKHLKIYRIRRKVDVESLHEKMKIWSAFEPAAVPTTEEDSEKQRLEGQIFPCGALSNKSTKLVDDIAIYEDPRIPELGLRILSSENATKEEIVRHLGFEVEDDAVSKYRELRYRLGIGEGIDDLPVGKAFPLEINCDYLHGVSFHKGCYIGQELTARTHHTGVVRKRLMPLTIHDDLEKNYNYDENMLDESGKVVGKFRGREGKFALGLMRISEALNARTITVSGSSVKTCKPRWWPKDPQKDKAVADTRK